MKAIKYELVKAPQKDSLILERVLDKIDKEFYPSSELKCNRVSSESPHRTDRILKGAGSFHIHRKTMKELCTLAVLGVREQPNLAHDLVARRH